MSIFALQIEVFVFDCFRNGVISVGICAKYNMSDRIVSDIQCRAAGETFYREFKNLLRQRRRQRRLKNEFTFYLRIPGYS